MTVNTPTRGTRDCGCGGDCPPGACAEGEECLPDNYIDPDDCPGGCEPGEECLPDNFIDPADCPAGCDPLDYTTIEGLVEWYDADDASTFTFTSGIEVDEWADKSGAGNDMITNNAFGGNPSRVVGAVNGRAAVFSGETFGVDSGSMTNALARSAPFQVIFVAQWNEPPGDAATPATGTGSDTWEFFRSGDGDLTVVANGGGNEGGFLATGVPHVVSVAFDNGVNSVYRIDGVEVFAGDLGIAGQTATLFFQNSGGGRALKGYMCEWVGFDRILTEEEQTCIEAGLALRWMTGACEDCPAGMGLLASPADIDGLLFEWDPDDGATLTLTGDVVDAMDDKSGNGWDLTTDGGTPTLIADGLNGAVIRALQDGNARMVTADMGGVAQPIHLFFVGRFGMKFNESMAMFHAGSGVNVRRHDGTQDLWVDAGAGFANLADLTDGPHLFTIALDGASSYIRIDGVQAVAADFGSDGIPDAVSILNSLASNNEVGGYFADGIAYDHILTADEEGLVEDYLLRKRFPAGVSTPDALTYHEFTLGASGFHFGLAAGALTPFGIYLFDDASGNPQDSSGNGNHCFVGGTLTYQEPPLSEVTDFSILLDLNSGAIAVPTPAGTFSDGSAYTVIGLLRLEVFAGAANGFPVFLSMTNGGADYSLLLHTDMTDGSEWTRRSRDSGENTASIRPVPFNIPLVYAIRSSTGPSGVTMGETFINGIRRGAVALLGGGSSNGFFNLGLPFGGFWGSPQMSVGPHATFSATLTDWQIFELSRCLMDNAMIAALPTTP